MKIDPVEVENRFRYHSLSTEDAVARIEANRIECARLAAILCSNCPESRELARALDSLDQVCMYANAAVARHQ